MFSADTRMFLQMSSVLINERNQSKNIFRGSGKESAQTSQRSEQSQLWKQQQVSLAALRYLPKSTTTLMRTLNAWLLRFLLTGASQYLNPSFPHIHI